MSKTAFTIIKVHLGIENDKTSVIDGCCQKLNWGPGDLQQPSRARVIGRWFDLK